MNHNLNFNIAPRQDIVEKIEEAFRNPPEEISINVIIKGSSAAKYNILKTMLSASFPDLEDEEIDKYIIRAGVERELEKFSNIIQ